MMAEAYISRITGVPVWQVDDQGNTLQAGSVNSGDGMVLSATATPGVPATGQVRVYSPDGNTVSFLTSNGVIEQVSGTPASSVAPVTIANSTTETVVSSFTVPANFARVGSMWQGFAVGVVSTAGSGSPQITANVRIGGVAGTVIASIVIPAIISQTNVAFQIGFTAACVTTGSAGTWTGSLWDVDVLSGPAANVSVPASPVTRSTLANNDLVLTLTWGAAISGNSATVTSSFISQIF
jgi:hypothetical protein